MAADAQVLLRGSWGTGFIAPTLTQLYGANQSGVSAPGLTDPIRCPVTGSSFDCDTQFGVLFGGNAALKPEKANQWQVGFVLEPTPAFSIGIDYFNIDLKNLFVNGFSQTTILNDLNQYGQYVTRGAPDAQFPNLPGRILQIDQRFVNIGEEKITGFDVDARATLPQTPWGRVRLSLSGTYFIKYRRAPERRYLRGLRVQCLCSGRDRHQPALEALRDGHVGLWSVVGDARAELPELVHRLNKPTRTAISVASGR